ncbi:hypothetical protein PMAYCL1PPCAC_27119, partial [Pristionchus mayeri]
MSTANIEEATISCSLSPKEKDTDLARTIEYFENLSNLDNFNRVACKVRPIFASAEMLLCELSIETAHINTKGTLHGGFSAALVDIITGQAIGVTVKDKGIASVEIAVSYLLPVKLGDRIKIDARVLKIGRSLAFADIEFRRPDGKIAVKGKHTVLLSDPPVT